MPELRTELAATTAAAPGKAGNCHHCGESCAGGAFMLEGKPFCCFGCQTVFSLLRESGLEQFYRLQSAPGIRIRGASAAAKWAFLDDPATQEKLFDYADPTRARVTLHLPAIHCIACVWLLENLFKLHPGIGGSLVNFSRREAVITFARDKIKFSELAALLASIGYEPELTLGEIEKKPVWSLRKKEWLQIGFAGFAFGNIMLMSLPFYFGLDRQNGPWFEHMAGWLGLAFGLPVVTYCAGDFWRAAWFSLRQGRVTMEVPIVLGLASIYATSIYDVVSQSGPGYGDSLCGLIFFLLCGRIFQKKTHERLTFDRDYKGFFPLSVVRKTAAGETTVAISRLQTGDQLVLRNAELLPADARLIAGRACMDYSFVTGESEPVFCKTGDYLYAGGRQVGGAVEVEIVKPVAQSYLATLWDNEAFRKTRDNDLDSLTNRYSRYFTGLVIGVAVAAAGYWILADSTKVLKAFTAVLIVACPCALALSAPLTHGTAQRILARLNIFLKNALVTERMAEVDTIVFDKTGTLTTADAGGVEFQNAVGETSTPKLSAAETGWIGSLARLSTHPNSVRITKSLSFSILPVSGFEEIPGCGIQGEVAAHTILLGSPGWLRKCGVTDYRLPEGDQNISRNKPGFKPDFSRGGSRVGVAVDGRLRGMFELQNSLRPEVGKLIAHLGNRFELALLSGDNEREAARFKDLFGAEANLRFNQSPADKLNFIRELQRRGRRVMMVGDGLNDAGALRQADVGVAVVEQIGVFSPASDVILDAAQLPRLAAVLKFSRQASRVVRAGFVISGFYNLAGISIAAAGLLAPIVCAILMPVSSATVVTFACVTTAWLGARTLKPGLFRNELSKESGLMNPIVNAWEAA
jgi:P-type Cu+ transporter